MKGPITSKLKGIVLSLCIATALPLAAVPARPGLWVTLRLTNGKEVRAQLVGDEWFHYYRDASGNAYVHKKDAIYKKVSTKKLSKLRKKSKQRRQHKH